MTLKRYSKSIAKWLAGFSLLASMCSAGYDYRALAEKAVVGGTSYEGVELQIDLPISEHVRNIEAPLDKKGCCVFASMDMGARWHNVRELIGIINKIREGGGWREKVDDIFKQYAPNLKYVQYEGTNPAILDKALSEGRAACVTYGYGERYEDEQGKPLKTIYHMVLLVQLDSKLAAILDNNFPGTYEWMSREEFLRRWVHPSGKGWAFVMLVPPPPPVPHN